MQLSKIRQEYTELIDFLKEMLFQKGILERPSYVELSKKLGFTYNWINNKKCSLKTHSPMKKTIDDFYTRLSKRYKDILINSWKTIEIKFQILYNTTLPTELNSNFSSDLLKKSIKRQFFNGIKEIIRQFFPGVRLFDRDLSRIFFRRARALLDSHLKGDYELRMLDKSTLFSMIYKIRFLTEDKLVDKIRDIKGVDKETLDKIKINLEKYIERFIFSNPYGDKKYISDKHDTGAEYFKPEYDLTLNIWFVLSKVKKGPILLKNIQKMLKYETFGRFSKGWEYSWDGIMKMLRQLSTLIPSEEFSKIFENVWRYVEQRNLYPALPRKYHSSWYAINTAKFHLIMLIIRDLGLDILTLEPIKPEAFKKTHIMELFTYERHHIYINNKQTIDVNRLALTMHKDHRKLEGKTDLVLDLIQSRIHLSFICPEYYKVNLNNWNSKWQNYMERRNYLIENGIENFIANYFTDDNGDNYIFNRFFKNVPKGEIEQEIKKIMQEWIDKGRPAPILNTYILNRLFIGTSNLVTSGYSEIKF